MATKKKDAAPDPLKQKHVQFTQVFVDEYQQKFGRKYVHQGPKDGSPLKAFIHAATDVGVDEWRHVLRRTWESRDAWVRNNCVSIAMVCSQWAKLVVLAGPTAAPAAPDTEVNPFAGTSW